MFTGHQTTVGGRVNDVSCTGITAYLKQCGLRLGRLKTGTPARLDEKQLNGIFWMNRKVMQRLYLFRL